MKNTFEKQKKNVIRLAYALFSGKHQIDRRYLRIFRIVCLDVQGNRKKYELYDDFFFFIVSSPHK